MFECCCFQDLRLNSVLNTHFLDGVRNKFVFRLKLISPYFEHVFVRVEKRSFEKSDLSALMGGVFNG